MMKLLSVGIFALIAVVYAADFEGNESCNCRSDTSESGLITIKCKLPKTTNQTSQPTQDNSLPRPRDCYDIKHANPLSQSGIYRIYPELNRPQGFLVRCDQDTDGGGWTMIQNRENGAQDFYQNFESYVEGFGKLDGEFWMGLQLLHELTRFGNFELRFDLSDFDDEKAYATYKKFSVGQGDGYVLNFDKNSYFGDAGDSLAYHHMMRFTAKDRDQDANSGVNCAQTFTGAFWYEACHGVNINGQYLKGQNNQFAKGVVWYAFKGHNYSLKTTEMKFRPDYIKTDFN